MARPRSGLSLVPAVTSLPRPKVPASVPRAASPQRPWLAAGSKVRVSSGRWSKPRGVPGRPAGLPPVRLVATDLDGTLLRPDGTVSERTICCRPGGPRSRATRHPDHR